MSLPCSTQGLIPQTAKMGFEQILQKASLEEAESTVIIQGDNIFLDDENRLSPAALVEYINQLIAAAHGFQGRSKQTLVQLGFFVGLQDAEFLKTAYLGDSLKLKATVAEVISQVSFINGVIYRNDDKIAEFTTKLYEVRNESEFQTLTEQRTAFKKTGPISVNQEKLWIHLSSLLQRKLFSYLQKSSINENGITFDIACPDSLEVFDGHFPGNPILPGVVMLEIGELSLNMLLKKPIVMRSIKKMKINGVVLPFQMISCVVKIDRTEGIRHYFSATYKEQNREICRFSGYCDEGSKS